ncbi:hypothetical protein [Streptomyces sp. NPDC057877]|uniref:hypothetical protein n=1 Tax=Streptomyces sp. NPDC057877 TaxID=3346269 RepID=UPI0036B9A00F
MDPQLALVAGAFGTAVVGAMASDGYQQAREGAVALWRRFRPGAADDVGQDLDRAREALLSAPTADRDAFAAALASAWQGHALTLLLAEPAAARAIEELAARLNTWDDSPHMTFHAHASGWARIYQSAGDQHINEW